MRIGKARRVSFAHNDIASFRSTLERLVAEDEGVANGMKSVIVAVESVYSMDGTIAPLRLMVDALEEVLRNGNGHLVVDEAHATGIYGRQGRGVVSMCGLEDKCLARIHTFGKAMTGTGGAYISLCKL